MALSRRKTLAILGGGAVLAAGGIGHRITRSPTDAVQPWAQAGLYEDPRKRALSYAILAPNPHNRQPWLVDLSAQDQVTLYVETDRLLPHTDPFSRQIVIGLGCFLEVLRIAASQDGYDLQFDLFPDGEMTEALDDRRVAVVRFAQSAATPDPLFAHVMNRRTEKEPYDLARPVADDILPRLEAACVNGTRTGSSNDAQVVQTLRELSNEALRIEVETPRTFKESVDLFRIGYKEVNANPDGIDFSGPIFEGMSMAGFFSREATLDTSSTAYAQGLAAVLENTDTAMAHIWMVTDGNSRIDQINAGRDWVRLNLTTTREGVAMQPLSQALQEYPEMAALYSDIHQMLAPEGGTVQMFARLGYCAPVPQSPRWPLEAKLV
ncbi:MAG: twin-arginine translocation pathway signal protein [Pseudomonadota bacterium]